MKKTYVIRQTHIVRSPNIGQAKSLIFENDGFGEILLDSSNIEEISEEEVIDYINEKDSSYTHSSTINLDKVSKNDGYNMSLDPAIDDISDSRAEHLRSENKRLARLADKYKNVQEEAKEAVYAAAYEAFSDFDLPKLKSPSLPKMSNKTPEVAVAVFSDWQLGKITPTYNSEVLAERIELYADKMIEIVNIQRAHHPVKDLHVWFLGDIVEGEEIFPGQSHLIDSGLYRQVGVHGPEIISKFLLKALENFETIKVTAIIGNHGAIGGRMRRMHDPETNMDRLLYKIVSLIFANEKRITFDIPDGIGERNWYAVDKIGNYSTLLLHGDQLPQPSNFGAYYKKVMGWKDGAIPEHFDDVFMGHYHQQFKMTIGSTILRISGSSESYNTYAQEFFSSMSRPCQHLMFVHPEHGITSEYSIWLD
jgi:hypothetical protein